MTSTSGAGPPAKRSLWIGGIGTLLLTSWQLQRGTAPEVLPRWRATLTVLVALASAVTLALSGTITIGQLMGVLTAAVAGCGIAAGLSGSGRGPEPTAGPLSIVFWWSAANCLLLCRTALDQWTTFAGGDDLCGGMAARGRSSRYGLAGRYSWTRVFHHGEHCANGRRSRCRGQADRARASYEPLRNLSTLGRLVATGSITGAAALSA